MFKQRQLLKAVKVGFKLVYGIQNRCQAYPWSLSICKALQIFTLIGFIVASCLNPLLQNISSLDQSNHLWQIIDLVVICFSAIAVSLLVTAFMLQYELFNQLGTLQQFKGIIKICNITATLLVYTSQIIYYILGCYLFWKMTKFKSTSTSTDYILVGTALLLYLVQSLIFLHRRLYAIVSIFLPPLLSIFALPVSLVIIIVATILLLYHESDRANKLLYLMVLLTCFWAFLELTYNPNNQFILACINLMFMISASIGVYFFYPAPLSLSIIDQNRLLLNYYKKRVGEGLQRDQRKSINLQEQIIYEQYFQQIQRFQQVCVQSKIRNVAFQEWKDDVMEGTLWSKIKWNKENNPSFQMNLFYFEAGIFLKEGVLNLLKEMMSYFQKNRSYHLLRNYQMYKVSQIIFKSYEQTASGNQAALQISDIIQAENNYNQFYSVLDQLLVDLAQFWKDIVLSEFKVGEQAYQKLGNIKRRQSILGKLLKSLGQYRIREQLKLYQMVGQIIDNYQVGRGTGEEINRSERSNSFQYIILQGQKIHKISLKLLKTLEYSGEDLDGHSIRSLLPNNFHLYLQQIYRRFLQKNEHTPFILPIIHSSGCLILKRCSLYMIPAYSTSIKYLLTVQNLQTASQLLLLYNITRQKVQIFNDHLRQFLGVKHERFKALANGQAVLFANDIFGVQLNQEQVNILKNHEVVKTKVVFPDFYLRKNNSYNYNDQVTLHLEQEFYFHSQQFVVINVQSQSYRQIRIQAELKTNGNMHTLDRQRNLHEQYAHQQFFCKIQNPFKSKIVQKVSNLKTRGYQSYTCQIAAVKIVLFLMIIINIILYRSFSNSKLIELQSLTQIMGDFNNQYIYLLKLYSSSYSNKLFIRDLKCTYNFLNSNFFANHATNTTLQSAVTNLTQFYDQQNDINSRQLMNTYLLYKGIDNHKQQTYQISFSNFNISTNTLLTNFYDFIVQVQQGFSDSSDISFLANNYNSILSIMPVYQQFINFSQDFNSQYQTIQIIAFIFIAFMILMIGIVFLQTFRLMKIHDDIKQLYNFIEKADVGKVMLGLDAIKTVIGQIVTSEEKRSAKHKYEQVLLKKDLIQQSQRQLEDRTDRQNDKSEQEDITQKQNCKTTTQNTFSFMIFCPLLFIYTIVVVYIEWSNIGNDKIDFYNILSLLQKFQTDQMWIERSYIGLFQQKYYQQYFGNYTNPYDATLIQKNHFPTDYLPSVFLEDINKEESLCQNLYFKKINIPYFTLTYQKCLLIESGVLTQGYSKALQIYQSYIRSQLKSGFNFYLSTKTRGGSLNKMSNIIYLREILSSFLQVKKTNFFTHLKDYLSISSNSDIQVLMYSVFMALLVLIVLIWNIIKLSKHMDLMIHLICIIPTTAMYKIRTTNYIRREGILAKMDKL